MDKEISGFVRHQCFTPLSKTPEYRILPVDWMFKRNRDGTAKARFVIGGHHQRLGLDYLKFQNYCAMLASRDNRVLLALAAGQGWSVAQTAIEQAFFHGVLNDGDLFLGFSAL